MPISYTLSESVLEVTFEGRFSVIAILVAGQ